MHTVKETDLLAAKIDLLMKRLDDHATDKDAMTSTVQVCGDVGYLGNNCLRPMSVGSRWQTRGGLNSPF
jgi:hypothetical protein